MKTAVLIFFVYFSALAQRIEQNPLSMGFVLNSDRIRMENERAERDRIEHIPAKDPFRIIGTTAVSVSSVQWVRFYGIVVSSNQDGLMVHGGFGAFDGLFQLRHFPEISWIGMSLDYSNSFRALPSGTIIVEGQEHRVPTLDYGTVFVPTVQRASASEIAEKKSTNAAKALKYNQDLAASGDPYGELRMGERYRDGDGVAKDMRQAREWFAKAAAQGDKTAAKSLAEFPQN